MIRTAFQRLMMTAVLVLASFACIGSTMANEVVRLATTTSTDNSGLLSYLLPEFEKSSGFKVHVIAVGTGKALRMGQDGDVDVVLVHAPEAEQRFVASGYGEKRHPVMYNDFIIVGPRNDPAAIKQATTTTEAFKRLAESRQKFISRGDDSGTHKKEMGIWQQLSMTPRGNWYREAGQGMGKVLQIAGEMDAYSLTDRGTWLAYQNKSPLRIVHEGDTSLHNPYGIIAVNQEMHSHTNYQGASALISWMTSAVGQKLIGAYRLHGAQLFTPSAKAQYAGLGSSEF